MKKIILSLFALIAFTTTLQAQRGGNVEFSIAGGVNFSNVNSYFNNADFNTGYNFQGGIDFYFSEYWSIKAKAIYDSKGWDNDLIVIESRDRGRPSGTYLTDFELDYITVPLMANFHFGYDNNWYINFGPYVGFLLDARATAFDTDVMQDFEDTDVGIAFGLGVKIPVNEYFKFFIEFDGQSGFTDIFERNNRPDVNNYRGAINVGLNFML
ncbi:porin family protein [Flavobacterium litorale]|uniref:PorT family protein n=1 Tax=Flavobacterium litorale TaxID=2856519 RepID=A0ABX8V576_9FLAO|nr:porin family protein [Flavobacterium litorale]QYJ67987.1 PorT family protein [Flavobacterium litorale]